MGLTWPKAGLRKARNWDRTYEREMEAVPDYWNLDSEYGDLTNFRPIIGMGNTMATLQAEWTMTILGTMLFGEVNGINYAMNGIRSHLKNA